VAENKRGRAEREVTVTTMNSSTQEIKSTLEHFKSKMTESSYKTLLSSAEPKLGILRSFPVTPLPRIYGASKANLLKTAFQQKATTNEKHSMMTKFQKYGNNKQETKYEGIKALYLSMNNYLNIVSLADAG